MSGRKKRSPQKLSSSNLSRLSWDMSNGSFHDDISMSTSVTSVNDSPFKDSLHWTTKKKACLNCSPKHIILGSVSVLLEKDIYIPFKSLKTIDVKYDRTAEDTSNIVVEINPKAHQHHYSVRAKTICDVKNIFPYIFTHSYSWIYNTRSVETIETMTFDIAVVEAKFPIPNAFGVVEYFFDRDYSDFMTLLEESGSVNPDDFFKEIKTHRGLTSNAHVQSNRSYEKLIDTIRPYQVQAIDWMVTREQTSCTVEVNWMDSLYDKLTCVNNKVIYLQKYTGSLTAKPDEIVTYPSGGILSDEMGLGKTVEVVACILNNPRNIKNENNSDYLLPSAFLSEDFNPISSSCRKSDEPKKKRRKKLKTEEDILDRIHEPIEREKGQVRKVLNEWYDKILSGYSTVKQASGDVECDHISKCMCGEYVNIEEEEYEDFIQCPECQTYQHPSCVNYQRDFCYYCPQCWSKQKKMKSCATLIISPSAICDQWVSEIHKHFKQDLLKIHVYKGVKDGFIQPSVLAAYDIVITSYNTLKAEIYHAANENESRTFRKQEKFLKITTSPLTQIQWWRFCLDEAQMVESHVSNTNQMAKLIDAVHRWSVTGTPIQKSINDLYYLVEFLRVEPYSISELWNACLYLPYLNGNKLPLLSVLSPVFWRNSKFEVKDEIKLPDQSIELHLLNFNAIEEHFYMRIHKQKSEQFLENVLKLKFSVSSSLKSLNKKTLSKLLLPLLHLRQACSHPQAVRGVFTKKGCLTKEELLEYLIGKTKVEAEDLLRKYIAATNGMAGVYGIKEEWLMAVEKYRDVLRFKEEYKNKVTVDSLQLIHAMNNLAEVLELHPQGIPPTLRDGNLRSEATELEKKYMNKKLEDLDQSRVVLDTLSVKVKQLNKKIRSTTAWWVRAIQVVDNENELTYKMQNDLSDHFEDSKHTNTVYLHKITSILSVDITLRRWLTGVEKERKKVIDHLDFIREITDEVLVSRAVECHLRPSYNTRRVEKCELCTGEKKLLNYECQLFDVKLKNHKIDHEKVMDGAQTKGSWRAHRCEVMLKSILNFSKPRISDSGDLWCVHEGSAHIQMLETMKKEFKQLRAVWMELNHRVQAEDELAMSKLKLRLKLPGEALPKKQTSNLSLVTVDKLSFIHIISPHEVDHMLDKLTAESIMTLGEFKKKHGTLMYLGNLGRSEHSKPEPCPVCRCELSDQWCVLQCGHSFCLECVHGLQKYIDTFKCPVCREVTNHKDVGFIDLSGRSDSNSRQIIGSHSTKMECVVRTIIDIKTADVDAKFVVFSTWTKVLDILAGALTENNISFTRMPGYKYQEQLKLFKDDKQNISVILLPIKWGSKGLNLTEANHLFLIEPITNPADELQAIGRIHRIGQTRATTVHRFLIRGTIEEKIQSAVTEANVKWEDNTVTIQDLLNLFV